MRGPQPVSPDSPPPQLVDFADDLQKRLSVLIDPAREPLRLPFLRSLRPQPDDYAQVFVPAATSQARAFYEAMWQKPFEPSWNPRHSIVKLHVALPEDFAQEHPRALAFPRGYRSIAPSLVPGVPWACFELLEAGDTLGVSTDGLVRCGERLVWFPRPYLALFKN